MKLTPLISIGKADIDFKVNYSYQTSEIKSLIGNVQELGIGNYNFAIVGQPAYVFKVPDYKRDPATGKVIVDKTTGLPSVDPNLAQFGRTTPDNILGLNLTVNWKGFTMAAVAEYRGGNQIVVDELGAFLDDNGITYTPSKDNVDDDGMSYEPFSDWLEDRFGGVIGYVSELFL